MVVYEEKLELAAPRLKKFSFQETGLVVQDRITFSEWEEAVNALALLEFRSTLMFAWNWGDLIAQGSQKWGQRYAEAIVKTGLSRSTLENYKWIASATPREVRGIPGLNFTHYLKVAKVRDFDQKLGLLLKAADNDWNAEGPEYARAIKLSFLGDSSQESALPPPPPPPPPPRQDWETLGTRQDEIFELQQKQVALESQKGDLVLQATWLADQAQRAIGLLSLITGPSWPASVDKVATEVIEILRTMPDDRALTLVAQVIDQFRQGDTTQMVDTLTTLSEIMKGENNG